MNLATAPYPNATPLGRLPRPSLFDKAASFLARIALWPVHVIEARRTLAQLAALSDYELRDVGLTRQDLVDITARPQEFFEGAEGRVADIVLDALRIGFRGLLWRANRQQEVDDETMALPRLLGHRLARLGEENAAIGARCRQPLAFQPSDRFGRRRMSDAEPASNVDGPRFAIGRDKIGDQFRIIFEHGGRTRGASAAEPSGLNRLGRQFLRGVACAATRCGRFGRPHRALLLRHMLATLTNFKPRLQSSA
jgi:uncharacterized protein YjiS (DUF1127 family)